MDIKSLKKEKKIKFNQNFTNKLSESKCFYCKTSMKYETLYLCKKPLMENDINYTEYNTIPICSTCKNIKSNFNHNNFINIVESVYNIYHKKKRYVSNIFEKNNKCDRFIYIKNKSGKDISINEQKYITVLMDSCVFCGQCGSNDHFNTIFNNDNSKEINDNNIISICKFCKKLIRCIRIKDFVKKIKEIHLCHKPKSYETFIKIPKCKLTDKEKIDIYHNGIKDRKERLKAKHGDVKWKETNKKYQKNYENKLADKLGYDKNEISKVRSELYLKKKFNNKEDIKKYNNKKAGKSNQKFIDMYGDDIFKKVKALRVQKSRYKKTNPEKSAQFTKELEDLYLKIGYK
jgi:hypothetical protein